MVQTFLYNTTIQYFTITFKTRNCVVNNEVSLDTYDIENVLSWANVFWRQYKYKIICFPHTFINMFSIIISSIIIIIFGHLLSLQNIKRNI